MLAEGKAQVRVLPAAEARGSHGQNSGSTGASFSSLENERAHSVGRRQAAGASRDHASERERTERSQKVDRAAVGRAVSLAIRGGGGAEEARAVLHPSYVVVAKQSLVAASECACSKRKRAWRRMTPNTSIKRHTTASEAGCCMPLMSNVSIEKRSI